MAMMVTKEVVGVPARHVATPGGHVTTGVEAGDQGALAQGLKVRSQDREETMAMATTMVTATLHVKEVASHRPVVTGEIQVMMTIKEVVQVLVVQLEGLTGPDRDRGLSLDRVPGVKLQM